MEIILKEDIENLGYKDEVVSVKPGYGRNFLIPKGKAILATESTKKVLNETMKQRSHKIEKEKEEAQKVVAALEKAKIVVGAKAGEKNKIFGSVNTIQIAASLANLGFKIDRKDIKMSQDAIKELGTYQADVKVLKDISVTINFDVVAE